MDEPLFYAHSANAAGEWDSLAHHLAAVAERAATFANATEATQEARLAGLLHDLGKYGDLFQRRLRGQEKGIDHWSAGAWMALKDYRAIAAALAIQGHHVGLQRIDKDSLSDLDPVRLSANHPLGLRLSASDADLPSLRAREELELPPALESSVYGSSVHSSAAAMLDVRMLFSALVDADYLETEAHFQEGKTEAAGIRSPGCALEAQKAQEVLDRHLASLAESTNASQQMMRLRADLLGACVKAAGLPQGLFTLSAPTGAGKTLSMLAFALRHALRHNLRRVIVVIPYLTIIEQTARIYRDVFRNEFPQHYIIEHHSLTVTRSDDQPTKGEEDEVTRTERLLAENWDAPIVITTSVQFLESLFANKPSACRKLHRLAQSIILFDEVQTLPAQLAIPTLATLSRLCERYRTSVVFATATQPAFSHLDSGLRTIGCGRWAPEEIARPSLKLFGRERRTSLLWPDLDAPSSWEEIARNLAQHEQALCIVNLKRHALTLIRLLREKGADHLLHLSTNMCPAHRQKALSTIRARLNAAQPCLLISTQCIEAGVDIDFPVVYRAFGPLEAIAQAAGRCNRNGTRSVPGQVHIFLPEQEGYPPGGYGQAAEATRILLHSMGPGKMDIQDPHIFDHYYRSLYDLTKIAALADGRARELKDAIQRQDFVALANLYRLIPHDTINVLVPYDLEVYEKLASEVRASGLTWEWIRRTRPHAVGLYRPKRDAIVRSYLEPVPLKRKGESDEWLIYLNERHYDRELKGLVPPEQPEVWIA